jgi:hypothetical protein
VLLEDLIKTKVILLHAFKFHEEQLYEMSMHLRNTFGDAIKEKIDQNNRTASLSKMRSGCVSVISFAFSHVHTKLYFFTCRSQLDIIERKASFIFGSALSLCVHYSIIYVNFAVFSYTCTMK